MACPCCKRCPDCKELAHIRREDCPATWDVETTRAAYLRARVVLLRLVSGNIDANGMRELAEREARSALSPMGKD